MTAIELDKITHDVSKNDILHIHLKLAKFLDKNTPFNPLSAEIFSKTMGTKWFSQLKSVEMS